jgi:hypothetical protein
MQVAPRPFGQLLGDSVSSVGRTWRALVPPALAVFVPAGLATLLIYRETGAIDVLDAILNRPGSLDVIPDAARAEFLLPFYRATALAALVNMGAASFVYVAAHHIVAADIAGSSAPRGVLGESLRHTVFAFSAWLVAALATGLLFVAGLTIWLIPASLAGANPTSTLIAGLLLPVLVGPAIWVWVSASMATPVVALERLGILKSLRRSARLVRGRWWPTFGYLLLVGLFGVVAVQLIQFVAIPLMALGGMGGAVDAAALVGIVAQGLIVAGIGAMTTWWYVDLRARKETLLSEDLH